MEIWHGLLLGIIQGATEFFPISSSGHLFLAETWLGLKPDINFTILLHAASLLAVIVVYRHDVWQLLSKAFNIKKLTALKLESEGVLAWQLVFATVCTVGVALLIEPYFESLLNLKWVAGTLIITGGLIVAAEKLRRVPHSCEGRNLLKSSAGDPRVREDEVCETVFTWKIALLLGLVQGLAVVPGISRSGLTIAFLIFVGLNRQLSVKLSFLLSIPTILGALVFMLKDEWETLNFDLASGVGFFASFVTALLAIWSMKSLVERRWIWFAPYCVLLGGGILGWLFYLSN